MFAGFDPEQGQTFFERKRWQSMIGALLLVGGSLGGAFYVASLEDEEPVEEEIIEAEISNFEMDEELEDEPEPEPEPEPPPPPDKKVTKTKSKPTQQPEIQNPDAVDQDPDEGEINSEGPGYGEGGSGAGTGGTGEGDAKPETKPEPKPETKPVKKKKPANKGPAINPDKPVDRPPGATAVKQVGGKPPVYPSELKKRNITGKVKVRLVIYKDGSVKGAKVLAKTNSVSQDEDPDLFAKANKLLLKSVAAAVQTWKFKPSMYKGAPITVYLTITIPFTLN